MTVMRLGLVVSNVSKTMFCITATNILQMELAQ